MYYAYKLIKLKKDYNAIPINCVWRNKEKT